jgi:hypothetical protein
VYAATTGSCEKNQRTEIPIGRCSLIASYTWDAELSPI